MSRVRTAADRNQQRLWSTLNDAVARLRRPSVDGARGFDGGGKQVEWGGRQQTAAAIQDTRKGQSGPVAAARPFADGVRRMCVEGAISRAGSLWALRSS